MMTIVPYSMVVLRVIFGSSAVDPFLFSERGLQLAAQFPGTQGALACSFPGDRVVDGLQGAVSSAEPVSPVVNSISTSGWRESPGVRCRTGAHVQLAPRILLLLPSYITDYVENVRNVFCWPLRVRVP